MLSNLLRFDSAQQYLIIDGESESLKLRDNRPWEFSYLLTTLERTISKEQIFIFFDNLSVGEGAARVTGFNVDYYKKIGRANKTYEIRGRKVNTVTPDKAYGKLAPLVEDPKNIVVYQNGIGFDNYLWAALCRHVGRKPNWDFLRRTIDTNALAKAYKKGVKNWDRSDPSLNFKWNNFHERGLKTGLATISKELGVDYRADSHHDGTYDCFLTWQVLKKLMYKINI